MAARFIPALVTLLLSHPSFAGSSVEQKELDIYSSIEKLDKINYLPTLLPVIFKHKDFIRLTEEQVEYLEHWRSENKVQMLSVMQEIAEKRLEITIWPLNWGEFSNTWSVSSMTVLRRTGANSFLGGCAKSRKSETSLFNRSDSRMTMFIRFTSLRLGSISSLRT